MRETTTDRFVHRTPGDVESHPVEFPTWWDDPHANPLPDAHVGNPGALDNVELRDARNRVDLSVYSGARPKPKADAKPPLTTAKKVVLVALGAGTLGALWALSK